MVECVLFSTVNMKDMLENVLMFETSGVSFRTLCSSGVLFWTSVCEHLNILNVSFIAMVESVCFIFS